MDGTRNRHLSADIPLIEGGEGQGIREWTQIWTHSSDQDRHELAQLVKSWSSLPGEIKKAILTIVSPYQPGGKQ